MNRTKKTLEKIAPQYPSGEGFPTVSKKKGREIGRKRKIELVGKWEL